MRKLLFTMMLLAGTVFSVFAQSNKEVTWKYTTKKIAANTYEVHMTATINGNWHLYAQDGGDGPVSTSFKFTKNPLLTTEGNVKEVGKMKKVFEDAFGSEVRFYEKTVDFVQIVKVKGKAKTNLAGTVEFMVCNDKECLPPAEVPFKIAIGG
ncbi:MAG: protein-disulfide reductase DsbD domain-containing protein [Chitinophagaceae bacterium]